MLQIRIESKEVVVATIDFSRMETLRKGGILSTNVILNLVEDKMECQLPHYDMIRHNGTKGIIELVEYTDCVTVGQTEK